MDSILSTSVVLKWKALSLDRGSVDGYKVLYAVANSMHVFFTLSWFGGFKTLSLTCRFRNFLGRGYFSVSKAKKTHNLCRSKSALSEHLCQTSHKIAWEDSKIITTNSRYVQRLSLEAWHINTSSCALNSDGDSFLPQEYLHLVANDVILTSI